MQESRPPLKFNFTFRIPSPYPQAPFLKLRNGIVFFHVLFSLFVAARWKFASWLSNCSNLINFEAKINCNTTRQNDLKCRKTCTGLKFDLGHLNGPQTKFIVDSLYKHPVHSCIIFHLCALCKLSFNEALWQSFSVTAARSNTSPRWALHLLPAPWWCAAPRRVSVYNKIDLTPRVRAQERGFGWQLREISGVEWSRSVSVYTTVNLEWPKTQTM